MYKEEEMAEKKRILFICQHNSGRSQIAEAYLKEIGGENCLVESAGFEPAEKINLLVSQVMKEDGVDGLSDKKTQSVFDLFKQGKLYDHVVTVCDDGEEKCPIFPGITKRWHMPFPDPALVKGTPEEQLEAVRKIRDMIKLWIAELHGNLTSGVRK
jgi:arsenate reductase